MKAALSKSNILGVEFCIDSLGKILEYIENSIKKGDKKLFIVTPNPELLVIAHGDTRYKTILNSADIALPDGVGVVIASLVRRRGLRSKISGVDFMQILSKWASDYNEKNQKNPVMTGFLGGRDGVADKTGKCLQNIYKNLKISYVSEEFDEKEFNNSKTDILFVAFGSPKQEEWISQHLDKLNVKIVMGVGGAFDMVAGKVRRAPYIVRLFGFEWLYRLIRQPWRIRRQMRLGKFVWLVLMTKH